MSIRVPKGFFQTSSHGIFLRVLARVDISTSASTVWGSWKHGPGLCAQLPFIATQVFHVLIKRRCYDDRNIAMSTGSGRPRKACGTCKAQKVNTANVKHQLCRGVYPVSLLKRRSSRLAISPSATSLSSWGHANSLQIRCTGERPICRRCQRLKHPCVYSANQHNAPDVLSTPPGKARNATNNITYTAKRAVNNEKSSSALNIQPIEANYLGIPKPLLQILVETYYENVYNATLLLHKRSFLQALDKETTRPHVVLSVCAWAAK